MKVDRALVAELAHLARLEVPEAAFDGLVSDLQGILDHVATLALFDSVEAQHLPVKMVTAVALRPDVPCPFEHRAEAMAAAPEVSDGAFVVPKVQGP